MPNSRRRRVTSWARSAQSPIAQDYSGREKLRAQSDEFRREAIEVTDGVYVAVGSAASNVILVQGDGGSIIVDTATDVVAARQIVEAFGPRLRTPVRAIVFAWLAWLQEESGAATVQHWLDEAEGDRAECTKKARNLAAIALVSSLTGLVLTGDTKAWEPV